MKAVKRLLKIVFLISAVLLAASFFLQQQLPDQEEILPQLAQSPRVTATEAEPFYVTKGEMRYRIEPMHQYELYGLLVSYHHSAAWFDYYHERWEDYINIIDLCVIWGDNVKTDVFHWIDYSSGSWTCTWRSKRDIPQSKWLQFNRTQLSNNHILANDEISQKLLKAKRGDQIFLRGYLAAYFREDNTLIRRSSTVIGDTDCETIYVTDFIIIKEANIIWRQIWQISIYTVIISFALIIILFFATPVGKR